MIERVAKALCKAAGTSLSPDCIGCEGGSRLCHMWPTFLNEALAAMEVMEEPTSEMLKNRPIKIKRDDARSIWRMMQRAALKEGIEYIQKRDTT